MRNDPFFKFVAAIVVAGVLTALVAPNHTAATPATVPVAAVATVQTTDGAQ